MRVAVLGCGVVGSQVVRMLTEHSADLTARAGASLDVVGVAVRDRQRPRDSVVDPSVLTTDALGLVRSGVDLVIEVIGGIEPARTLILEAMECGASVVTANKALLATDGALLHAAAEKHGVDLFYEASVGAAIPLLRPLRESLAVDRVRRLVGIVNGTCNYILTRMDETGASFDDALAEAIELGYAEADPTADVGGFDAAAKAAILAGFAFHTRVTADDVHREGITSITAADVERARAMGCVIKSLAICELADDGESIGVRAHPALLPRHHPLAAVREAYNAVVVEADAAGRLMFYGAGAGGAATASAVLGDLVAAARHRVQGSVGVGESTYAALPIRPVEEARTRYHVALDVTDRAGVLAEVAQVFAARGVSISSVRQDGRGGNAALAIVTHPAAEGSLVATVDDLHRLEDVRNVVAVLRFEGEP
jgi:homoserine dehydrogenase